MLGTIFIFLVLGALMFFVLRTGRKGHGGYGGCCGGHEDDHNMDSQENHEHDALSGHESSSKKSSDHKQGHGCCG